MTTFFDAANAQLATLDAEGVRRDALDAARRVGLPTTSDEVWRYAPLSDFSLDHFALTSPAASTASPLAASLRAVATLTVTVTNGALVAVSGELEGVTVSTIAPVATPEHDAAFELLNTALQPSTLRIEVAPGVSVPGTVLVIHDCTSATSFPRTDVRVGERSSLNVLEVLVGGENALVVPVTTYDVAASARLSVVTVQRLARTAWHVARSTTTLHTGAHVQQSIIGLGGHYNRSRNDALFLGTGANNELWTTCLGRGNQVHDFRTHQLHRVGRTNSTLLSKGAVADSSRSIYTGLIEIERGAKRTDARQTNHNLLLSPHAHADTVPNLDIQENDVTCAHASSVGPLDELQRWYLESRGVSRTDAERLMIQGFFNEMLTALPTEVTAIIEADVAADLDEVVGR